MDNKSDKIIQKQHKRSQCNIPQTYRAFQKKLFVITRRIKRYRRRRAIRTSVFSKNEKILSM